MTTPAERQRVLDTLGTMFGYPYRPYTAEEWNAAYQQEGIDHMKPLSCPHCCSPMRGDSAGWYCSDPNCREHRRTEHTEQGEQTIIPGAERSARQAAASRESVGRGKIRPRKPQKDPGELFAPKEVEQPKLL